MQTPTRIYVNPLPPAGVRHELDDENARIVRSVMRLRAGDAIELFDGRGRSAKGSLEALDKKRVSVRTGEISEVERFKPAITLIQALPKGEMAASIVQKGTEWGISSFVFVISDRTIVKRADGQIDRFKRIAIEALRQSENPFLPDFNGPFPLSDALGNLDPSLRLHFDENLKGRPFALPVSPGPVEKVVLAIGPEGGWTDSERALFAARGFHPVGLAPHVLKADTAVISALAVVWTALSSRKPL